MMTQEKSNPVRLKRTKNEQRTDSIPPSGYRRVDAATIIIQLLGRLLKYHFSSERSSSSGAVGSSFFFASSRRPGPGSGGIIADFLPLAPGLNVNERINPGGILKYCFRRYGRNVARRSSCSALLLLLSAAMLCCGKRCCG